MEKKEFLHEFTKHVIITVAKKRAVPFEKVHSEERIPIMRIFPGSQLLPAVSFPSAPPAPLMFSAQQTPQVIKPLPVSIPLQAPAPARPSIFPVDIGKLNSLASDPAVNMIECLGSKIKLKIKKDSSTAESETILDDNEIKNIINKFSEASKEKVTEPVFKAAFGGWELTAVVSDIVGTRFILKRSERKMLPVI